MGITGTFQGYVDSPLTMFNSGTWNGVATTGMETTCHNAKYSENLTVNDYTLFAGNGTSGDQKYIGFTATARAKVSGEAGHQTILIKTKQKINMSPYKTISIYITGSSGVDQYYATYYFGVSSNASLTSMSFTASTSQYLAGKTSDGYVYLDAMTKSIDISSVNGDYYLYIGAVTTHTNNGSGVDHSVFIRINKITLTA